MNLFVFLNAKNWFFEYDDEEIYIVGMAKPHSLNAFGTDTRRGTQAVCRWQFR